MPSPLTNDHIRRTFESATRCCQRGQGESECCRSRHGLEGENEADVCAWPLYLPLLVLSNVYCK